MNPNLEVARLIQFVSLDTHPANNALVVTYEILVTASLHHKDGSVEELERRSKRHQFQMHVSALDKLTDLERTNVDEVARGLNLQELAQEVVRKCPRGLLNHRHLEEIQLHLLYLVGRRRGSSSTTTSSTKQPTSAASLKLLRSQQHQQDGINIRSQSASGRRANLFQQNNFRGQEFANVYAQWRFRENRDHLSLDDDDDDDGDDNADGNSNNKIPATREINSFLKQFESHLSRLESEMGLMVAIDKLATVSGSKELVVDGDDEILEGLYGDCRERLVSVGALRRLSGDDKTLAQLVAKTATPRLLLAALLRTLRDSRAHQHLCQSILYCLIRFTMFDDLYAKMFVESGNKIELEQLGKLTLDLVSEQVALLTAPEASSNEKEEEKWPLQTLRAMFLIITNLLRCDQMNFCRQLSASISLASASGSELGATRLPFVESLMQLVVWAGGGRGEQTNGVSHPMPLMECLNLLTRLSIFKEFVEQARRSKLVGEFVDGLTSLIDAVQTARPTSGAKSVPQTMLLSELYQLELAALKLCNQLMLDQRLRQRLIKRQLVLKCILRSLVMFLASGEPFELYLQSSCLLVPFKGLYELSCDLPIRQELFRSKIIIKCLLEYLLASISSFGANNQAREIIDKYEDEAIVLNGNHKHTGVDQYVVCLWVNLSALSEAPIYKRESNFEELFELCQDYISKSLTKLASFVSSLKCKNAQPLMIYLHAKLIRNLTQFMPRNSDHLDQWLESITKSLEVLAFDNSNQSLRSALLVESLAILGNLLDSNGGTMLKNLKADGRWFKMIGGLFKRLAGSLNFRETDNDDLLLVTILLLGRFAQNTEVCQAESSLVDLPKLIWKICEASESILESRQSDEELLVSCLFTLTQLMRHSSFVLEMSASDEQVWETACRLADKLAQLLRHPNRSISCLSVWLLARLRQLEEQRSIEDESLVVHKSRFGAYNDKWLAAMRSGRAAPSMGLHQVGQVDPLHLQVEDYGPVGRQDEDELRDLRTFTADTQSPSQSSNLDNFGKPAKTKPSLVAAADDTDATEDEESNGISDDDDGFSHAPDVTVIDAQSMIKHLTLT